MFAKGIYTGTAVGVEGTGITPKEVRGLRTEGARGRGYASAGHVLEVSWAIRKKGDPLALAASTFVRYAREWWEAMDDSAESFLG